jgi:translocator protein
MSGLTHLRLAALCTLTYGLLVVSGLLQHFYRTGSFRALARNLGNPWLWVVVVLAVVLTFGLWKRQAWAWWLAIGVGLFQVYRFVNAWIVGGWRTPPTSTLILLALLVLMILLLLPRKARLAANG